MVRLPDVDQIVRKTRHYEFSDGLRDLQMAVYFAVSGAALWLLFEPSWASLVAGLMSALGPWAVWIFSLPVVAAPIAVWGMLRLMDYLRQRWLWRHTGMVKPVGWIVPRWASILAALVLLAGFSAGFLIYRSGLADGDVALRMFWVALGWSTGTSLVGMGLHIGLSRYIRLGILGAILSTGLLLLPLTFGLASLVFGTMWSLLLIVSGALTLRRAVPIQAGTR